MLFEKQIYDYLRGMVSIPSVSNTPQEKEVSDYIAGCLERQPYFAKHPSLCGQCALEGDSLGRTVVYGLVRGKGAGTVVLTGHYDVVDTDEYGRSAPWHMIWRHGSTSTGRNWRRLSPCCPRRPGMIWRQGSGCSAGE